MTATCVVCSRPTDAAPSVHRELHAQCLADRLATDLVVALLGLVALVAAPTVVLWAA